MRNAIGIAALSIIASVVTTGAADQTAFAGILQHYEAIRQALIGNSTDGVATHADGIRRIAKDLEDDLSPAAAGVEIADVAAVRDLLPEVLEQAGNLAGAKGLDDIRSAFAELTKPLVRWQSMVEGTRPVVVYCPMVKRSWLQPDEAIGNPYTPSMLRCGEVVSK